MPLIATPNLNQPPPDYAEFKWVCRAAYQDWYRQADQFHAELWFIHQMLIPILTSTDTVVDYGCGNRWLPLVLANHCKRVQGYALSEKLILPSLQDAYALGIQNVHFHVASIKPPLPEGRYSLACCIGTTRYYCDEDDLSGYIEAVTQHINPSGYLLIRDMLAVGEEPVTINRAPLQAVFRPSSQLRNRIEGLGYTLLAESSLGQGMAKETPYSSHIFLFQKRD